MAYFGNGVVQICVLGVAIAVVLALYKIWLRFLGIVIIPDSAIGLVTKKFVLMGRNRQLPPGRIIALNGEAGFQADTLARCSLLAVAVAVHRRADGTSGSLINVLLADLLVEKRKGQAG